MGETSSLFILKYKISLENYISFYFAALEETFKKPRKRSLILGVAQLLVGSLLLITMLAQKKLEGFIVVIVIFLVAMGLYSIFFYKLFFPLSIKKTAKKQYNSNEYLKSEITLDFYPDKLIETSKDGITELLWGDIYGFKIAQDMYLIMVNEKRCIIVPKEQINEKSSQLNELLKEISNKFEKKYILQ